MGQAYQQFTPKKIHELRFSREPASFDIGYSMERVLPHLHTTTLLLACKNETVEISASQLTHCGTVKVH